jgi:ABC-2 type transport system ATP-binding protein
MNIERNAITVEGLRKRYPDVTAVDGLSFHVEAGEFFGLVGASDRTAAVTAALRKGILRLNQ